MASRVVLKASDVAAIIGMNRYKSRTEIRDDLWKKYKPETFKGLTRRDKEQQALRASPVAQEVLARVSNITARDSSDVQSIMTSVNESIAHDANLTTEQKSEVLDHIRSRVYTSHGTRSEDKTSDKVEAEEGALHTLTLNHTRTYIYMLSHTRTHTHTCTHTHKHTQTHAQTHTHTHKHTHKHTESHTDTQTQTRRACPVEPPLPAVISPAITADDITCTRRAEMSPRTDPTTAAIHIWVKMIVPTVRESCPAHSTCNDYSVEAANVPH